MLALEAMERVILKERVGDMVNVLIRKCFN